MFAETFAFDAMVNRMIVIVGDFRADPGHGDAGDEWTIAAALPASTRFEFGRERRSALVDESKKSIASAYLLPRQATRIAAPTPALPLYEDRFVALLAFRGQRGHYALVVYVVGNR